MIKRLGFSLIILGGMLAYILMSSPFSFWSDELFSIYFAKMPILSFLHDYVLFPPDVHPPLFYLFMNVWSKVLNITMATDWLYRLPAIIAHGITLTIIARTYLTHTRHRVWFLMLGMISSYFFTYSHMVRYYSLVAMIYVLAFTALLQWVKTPTVKKAWQWQIAAAILFMADYPSYLFLAATGLMLIARYRLWQQRQLYVQIGFHLLGILPTLLFILRFISIRGNWFAEAHHAGFIANLAKVAAGIAFVPYHIIVGEFFHPAFTVVLWGVVFMLLLDTFLRRQKSKDTQVFSDTDLWWFIGVNIVSASVFLSFAIGLYPIFSYARFLLPCGYLLLVLLVRAYSTSRLVLPAIIGLNALVLSGNLAMTHFINPIYFYPGRETVALARRSTLPILITKDGKNSPDYVLKKQVPERVIENFEDMPKGSECLVFTEHRMGGRVPVVPDISADRYQILREYGYDNIAPETKRLLQKTRLMKIQDKYTVTLIRRRD